MFGMDWDIKIIPSSNLYHRTWGMTTVHFVEGENLHFLNINHYLAAHRWTNLLTRTIMTLEMGLRQPWPK